MEHRSITGGCAAPLQLVLTVWLALRGVLGRRWGLAQTVLLLLRELLGLVWSQGTYGNWSPSIPAVSAASSLLTALVAGARLNLPPVSGGQGRDWLGRQGARLGEALASLPTSLVSCLFRVLMFSYIWVYLHFYSLVPLCCLLLTNLLIFYFHQDSTRWQPISIFVSLRPEPKRRM